MADTLIPEKSLLQSGRRKDSMAPNEKLDNLIHLVNQAMTTCHYDRAERLFRQLLREAFETGDMEIIAEVSKAFMVCRRLRALDALQILKRIDPIQSLQKELS